jgi:hypothetical protein
VQYIRRDIDTFTPPSPRPPQQQEKRARGNEESVRDGRMGMSRCAPRIMRDASTRQATARMRA